MCFFIFVLKVLGNTKGNTPQGNNLERDMAIKDREQGNVGFTYTDMGQNHQLQHIT